MTNLYNWPLFIGYFFFLGQEQRKVIVERVLEKECLEAEKRKSGTFLGEMTLDNEIFDIQ